MAVTSLVTVAERIVKAVLEETLPDDDVCYVVFFEELCDPEAEEHRVPSVSVFVTLDVPSPDGGVSMATISWGIPLAEAMDATALADNVRERAQGLVFQRMAYLERDVATLGADGGEEPTAE